VSFEGAIRGTILAEGQVGIPLQFKGFNCSKD
jgi:hypothetical protein